MGNRIFLKVSIVISIIVLIYICFITFVISPKATNYLTKSETKQAKAQLSRVTSVIKSHEEFLKKRKEIKTSDYKDNIKDISHIAYNFMNNNYELFKKGLITKEEALENSIEAISNIKFGFEDDYIYILDRKGDVIYHPDVRYKDRNLFYETDVNGKLFIPTLIENSLKNGSTYTKYSWVKLNSNFISEKIVYSLYFEPLDLIINAGVYIKSIEEELQKEKRSMLKELYPLINSIVIGDKGYIYIMDENDKMLLHPNKKLVDFDMSSFKQKDTNKLMVEELKKAYKEKRAWVYKWNSTKDLDNYNYDKISWVDYNEFFKWYIVSTVYKEDLEGSAKQINKITINSSIIFLLFLLLVAIFYLRRVLKPISIMSTNAQLVKNGRFDVRNNLKEKDELGVLAQHFDSMLDYIEDNTKNLEQKVEERTALLKHKLYHDEKTGLKNREALLNDLKKDEFKALSIIDIDDFDYINDSYGFKIGNKILIAITKVLEKFTLENKLELYKLESDLFAILDLNMNNFINYDSLMDKVHELFEKEFYIEELDLEVYISITIGVSISQEDSLKSANIALKKAKQMKLKYMVYNSDIDTKESVEKTLYYKDKMKTAIEENRVIPFHQAIFNKHKEIIKYETLMRILEVKDGKEEYLSPGFFYDISLKTKQYFKLNQMVIEKTLTCLDQFEEDVSLNMSFVDLLNTQFNELLYSLIKKLSKEQRKRVVFEILESDLISDYQILDEFIFKYRKLGVKIAIDDFGTGFSNFSHILAIKPDYIKIDGSLIKDIHKDEKSYEIVKSIVEFSKALNIKTIAEFIHCKEVYEIVSDLEVDEFQGFYLGEPKRLIK